jgi:hypothetical protein
MATKHQRLERSISPSARSTRALVASLDERHGPTAGVRGREWRELRSRVREALRNNASGEISAADVVAFLYSAGFDQ